MTIVGHPPWVVLVVCSLTFAGAWIYGSANNKESSPKPIYDATAAQMACERFVEARLKAPATADFAPFHKQLISGNGKGPWTVIGYVDSQNSFGAMLRSNYTCTVEFSGNSTNLTSLSLY